MGVCVLNGAERIEVSEPAKFAAGRLASGSLVWRRRLDLTQPWQAEAFVRRHLRSHHEVHALRRVLARNAGEMHRLDDQQVFEQISRALRFGRLRADVYAWLPQIHPDATAAAGDPPVLLSTPLPAPPVAKAAPAAAPATPTAAATPMVAAPVEVATPVDSERQAQIAAAQDTHAAMLLQAAQSAVPFCEICELAKQQLALPVANPQQQQLEATQNAQAAVLVQAATNGKPFCEICERNK